MKRLIAFSRVGRVISFHPAVASYNWWIEFPNLNDVIISMTAHLLYIKVVDPFTIFTDINSLPLKMSYNKERSGCSFRWIAFII